MDLKIFAQMHSMAVPTLKKYLAMSEMDVEKLSQRHILNRNKNTIIGPYLNIIYKMLRDGFKGDFIYSYILHLGYKGKPSTMIDIIKCIALNNFGIHLQKDFPFYEDIPASVSVITRSNVLKYITIKDNTAMEDSDTAKYISVIKESYPIVSQAEEMYQLFHSILMGGKPTELDGFIDRYKDMKGIEGFIEGLKRDITPVKNAISLPFSSGFVEGNNNKFKLIKHSLYGRSGLANLFRKCYAAFSITQTNVPVQSLIPGLDKRIKNFTEKIMVLTQ